MKSREILKDKVLERILKDCKSDLIVSLFIGIVSVYFYFTEFYRGSVTLGLLSISFLIVGFMTFRDYLTLKKDRGLKK
jgi:membrane-bound ClpP family serine protease